MRIVLLPGMDGTGQLFKPLLDLMVDIPYSVISYPCDKILSYDELVQFTKKQLPHSEDYLLIAESFSGPIAFRLMQEGVARLKKTIFLASFISSPRPELLAFLIHLPIPQMLKLKIPSFLVRRYLMGPTASSLEIEKFHSVVSSVNTTVLASRLREIAQLPDPIGSVNCSCSYIQAEDDKLVLPASFNFLKRIVGNCTLHKIKGSHLVAQSNPGDCYRIIKAEYELLNY